VERIWRRSRSCKASPPPRPLADARARERSSHIGYYLIDAGQNVIKEAIGYDAPFAERIRGAVRRWPTFFYLSTIALATCGIFAAVLARSAGPTPTARQFAIVLMIALIPVMECAIAVTNLLVTHLLKPERLPRLDFSAGIPEECRHAGLRFPSCCIRETGSRSDS